MAIFIENPRVPGSTPGRGTIIQKAKAKLHKSNKPTYISKAERAKLAEQELDELSVTEKSTKPVDW